MIKRRLRPASTGHSLQRALPSCLLDEDTLDALDRVVAARSHGLPLLTRDDRHYRKIPDLVVEMY